MMKRAGLAYDHLCEHVSVSQQYTIFKSNVTTLYWTRKCKVSIISKEPTYKVRKKTGAIQGSGLEGKYTEYMRAGKSANGAVHWSYILQSIWVLRLFLAPLTIQHPLTC